MCCIILFVLSYFPSGPLIVGSNYAPLLQRGSLHAARRAECGGDSREDGDYDVEDLAPGAVVVECSHFV